MDGYTIFLIAALLTIMACTLYILAWICKALAEVWYAFCKVANALDRAIGRALDMSEEARLRREARKVAPAVPEPADKDVTEK